MKKIIKNILIVTVSLGLPYISICQDIDEIIANHLEAHGDLNKWEEVDVIKINGQFTAFSEVDDFLAYKTKEGGYYSELSLGKNNITEAFDGEKGWTIDPWQEIFYARELNKNEVNVFKQKAQFFTPFYKYKENGIKAELVGKQDIDGIEVFVIKITRPNGREETWYLDADTYLEYKCESYWVDFAYPSKAETYFEDFRDVDGLIIPFYVERIFGQRNRMLEIESIEINPEFDKSILEMPRRDEISKLEFITGNFEVKNEAWYQRGNRWYTAEQTTSNIEFISTNLIQEKINQQPFFVEDKILNFTYNSDLEHYLVSVFNSFTSNINIFDGYLNDTSFVAIKRNLDCSDTTQNPMLRFNMIRNDNGMTVIYSSSYDEGESWNDTNRLTYTRKED